MLTITNLTKTFHPGTPNQKPAIRQLDLHLEPGEFVTLIGSNGAGKSTLLNLIAGTILPDGGTILLDGEDITFQREHRRARSLGRVFQDPLRGTAPSMTVEENLALSLRSARQGGFCLGVSQQQRRLFRERLSRLGLGLEERLKSPIGLLSGGQRQAITLLMATMAAPKLLLLDEHTAALDPATAGKVLELTAEIVAEKRIATLMVTHNIGCALRMGSRTVMMSEGRMVLDLTGEQRREMDVPTLLELFRQKTRQTLDNDRMLLTQE